MSSSLPGDRELPESQFDLNTYWGRVRQSMQITDPRTLFTTPSQLASAKSLLTTYKTDPTTPMTPTHWHAKKLLDATLHPDTGAPVLLPFRMSSFVLSNLIVTAGMLTPNLTTRGTVAWQFANQSLNVAINASNANKSSPLGAPALLTSYAVAVSASCTVAVGLRRAVPRLRVSEAARTVAGRLVPFVAVASAGAVNVFLMRGEELRRGVDVFPVRRHTPSQHPPPSSKDSKSGSSAPPSLGKSRTAAFQAVSETALSRVLNATPVMAIPPLLLVALQRRWRWLQQRPRMVLPVNLGLIFATSVFALPLALAVFPQRRVVRVDALEGEMQGGRDGGELVWFNRGI